MTVLMCYLNVLVFFRMYWFSTNSLNMYDFAIIFIDSFWNSWIAVQIHRCFCWIYWLSFKFTGLLLQAIGYLSLKSLIFKEIYWFCHQMHRSFCKILDFSCHWFEDCLILRLWAWLASDSTSRSISSVSYYLCGAPAPFWFTEVNYLWSRVYSKSKRNQ